MKYTRYDYKKKNNDNLKFILVIVGILLMAILLGTFISKIVLRGEVNNKEIKPAKENVVSKDSSSPLKISMIQVGYFGKQENADSIKTKINSSGFDAFYINDDGKIRVCTGIFEEKEAEELSKQLKDKGIDNIKVNFQIDKKDICDQEIAELISANLKILNKLKESDVKSIQTQELKKWLAELKEVNKDSKNYAILEEIKKQTSAMPDEVSKEKLQEYYNLIYGQLVKLKKTA